MRRHAAAAALIAILAGSPLTAGEPFPYDLTVLVRSAEEVGRESLRDEAERLLSWDLESARCFRRVSGELPETPDGDDLAFRVTLVDVEEETSWDLSIAQRNSPNQQPGKVNTSQTVRLRADLLMELIAVEGERVVRSKTVRVAKGYRPRFEEDPRLEARQLLMEEAVSTARRWACKGSAKGLDKELRKARSVQGVGLAGD